MQAIFQINPLSGLRFEGLKIGKYCKTFISPEKNWVKKHGFPLTVAEPVRRENRVSLPCDFLSRVQIYLLTSVQKSFIQKMKVVLKFVKGEKIKEDKWHTLQTKKDLCKRSDLSIP